jgi:WD40 repeat protein
VRLLALGSGKEVRAFDGPARASAATLSRDGRTLAVLDETGTVRLWDTADGKEFQTITPARDDKLDGRLALSADGKRLAVLGLNLKTIELFDTTTGRKVREFPGEGWWTRCATFSPDGKTLAVAERARLRLWDVATGQERLTGGPGHLWGAAFGAYSSDGRTIVSAGWDGRLCLWDGRTGAPIRSWQPHVSFSHAALSPDGKRVLACGNDEVRVFDAATGKELHRFRGETTGVMAADLSSDGKLLALTEGKGEVVLRRADDGSLVRRFAGQAAQHDNLSLALSPDGRLLAGLHRLRLHFWDVATGADLPGVEGDQPYGRLVFSPDGGRLTAFSGDNLTTWDVSTRKKVSELALDTPSALDLHAFALSPDGRVAVTSDSSGEFRVWELASGRERFRFASPSGLVFSLAFAPDGRTLLTGNADGTLLAWDVAALPRPVRAPERLAPEDLARLWSALAQDAAPAHDALRTLAARPAQTVPFLRERLHPVVEPDAALLKRLVAGLDDEDFDRREKASAELAKLGEAALSALRKAEASGSAEVRQRAERLVARLEDGGPEQLRQARAVEVLERCATPEACKLLDALAAGVAEAHLTRAARAATTRLEQFKPR